MVCGNCLNFDIRCDGKYCPRCGWHFPSPSNDPMSRAELIKFERQLVSGLTKLRTAQVGLEKSYASQTRHRPGVTLDRLMKQLLLLSRVESELRGSLIPSDDALAKSPASAAPPSSNVRRIACG